MLNELYSIWEIKDKGWGVEILKGAYEGTVVQIEDIKFHAESENVELIFHILKTPDGMLKEDLKVKDFDDMMQCIVGEMIANAIEEDSST